ncbi:MAG: hypothetical protein FWC56_04800 [Phycisphaerae bacterium]|nr:hypothetical protein [Phycisphaerae bacterium]
MPDGRITLEDLEKWLSGLVGDDNQDDAPPKAMAIKADGLQVDGDWNIDGDWNVDDDWNGYEPFLGDEAKIEQEITDIIESYLAEFRAENSQAEETGVCARVKIQIDQKAVISRSGFKATLELQNDGGTPLENVNVTLVIKDSNGNIANDRFGIYDPELVNISDMSGSGSVLPQMVSSAAWTIISGESAAPTEATAYTVGGTLAYTINGQQLTIPLLPADITVLPNPKLHLKYFLERDVYSDDPFTPEVEPAVPFSLGLLVTNSGAGVANNLRITSSQPKIIENEKGLMVDFLIIGTMAGGRPYSPSLTVNLGDIGPNRSTVAQWIMTCSLQGKFIDYSATFEHVNGLGQKQLSIIDSVEIMPMTHVVRVDWPVDDGLPDFLVIDPMSPEYLPNAIHSSDGEVLPVKAVTEGTAEVVATGTRPKVQVSAQLSSGWNYLRINNPMAAKPELRLVSVKRSDGKQLRIGDNVWTTHRIVRLKGQNPYAEDFLHILDLDGSGSYTLEYQSVLGDLTGDGTVGAEDFQLFKEAFGQKRGESGYLEAADFDGDGIISLSDYQTWLAHYRAAIGNPSAAAPGSLTDE